MDPPAGISQTEGSQRCVECCSWQLWCALRSRSARVGFIDTLMIICCFGPLNEASQVFTVLVNLREHG